MMTNKQHRVWSIVWFVMAILWSSVFYVVLLRQFGALPVVKENGERIEALEAKVDSLRHEVFRVQP